MAQVNLAGKSIGSIGYGMMGLTWRATPPSQSQAFEAMSTALAQGANFWNGGEIYGVPDRHSAHLLREYFEAHPGDADKIVLSIKGGCELGTLRPVGTEENIRRSVEDVLEALGGTKTVDIFECARVDPDVPIEKTLGFLKKLVAEGKIGAVGLSEVRASTIERAVKIVPIAAVEAELSIWAADILRNGVAETCARLDIPIVAYSPLMRGALAGDGIKKNSDLADSDFRKHLPKFQDDALAQNNRITEAVEKLAKRKGVSKPQIAISWVKSLSGRRVKVFDADGNEKEVQLGTIIPIPGSTTKERVTENTKQVEFSDEEMSEIQTIIDNNP